MSVPRLERLAPDPFPERSDDELMELAQAGGRDAFGMLVERHAERLVQACSRFVNDPDVGAEIAQETWVAAWTARSQYRPEGKFFVWLLMSARNRWRNQLRHRSAGWRHAQRARDPALEPACTDQVDELLVAERRRRVRDALARLPGPMSEALLLRYAEELEYEEMAVVLRTGQSTLRSRVHHGLRLLKKKLEKNR